MDDADFWHTTHPDDLWLFDKLILAKKLGYLCGPAGVAPPCKATYIVRPCVNYRMMACGAQFLELSPESHSRVPDGYFWSEVFSGPHRSFDYYYGSQTLAVEGFRDDPKNLQRFSRWTKITETFELPPMLKEVALRYPWLNIETIGNNIIEVHLRYNDDFQNHTATTIIPVWQDKFYPSACGERVGFILE